MVENNGERDINNLEKLHLGIWLTGLDKNIIGVKLVFRTKLNAGNSINKHKIILIIKGYA